MRLQLEGVDIGDRAREQALMWESHSDEFVSLFYDANVCFTHLMAGDSVASVKLMDNIRAYIRGSRKVIIIFNFIFHTFHTDRQKGRK